MNNQARTVLLEQIAAQISEAASSSAWRPGHILEAPKVATPIAAASHFERIHWALERARQKSFVPMVKPFRRLFRNQGAVNNNLIEAVHHLAAQNQDLVNEITNLHVEVAKMQRELRRRRRVPSRRGEVRPLPMLQAATSRALAESERCG